VKEKLGENKRVLTQIGVGDIKDPDRDPAETYSPVSQPTPKTPTDSDIDAPSASVA